MKFASLILAVGMLGAFSSAHAVDYSNENFVCGKFEVYLCATVVGLDCPNFTTDEGRAIRLVGTTSQAKIFINDYFQHMDTWNPYACAYTRYNMRRKVVKANFITQHALQDE